MTDKKLEQPFATATEEASLIRAAATDPGAFRPLYEGYFKRIFLFVLHRVGEREVAADITQQVFLNALTHIGRFQFRGLPFSAWLFRIAINQCHDYFRKTKRTRTVVLEEASLENLHDELTADQTREEWEKHLPRLLEQLKSEELNLVELRFFEGRPFKEIGEILGITETYAKVRTYRLLEKMKKMYLKKR